MATHSSILAWKIHGQRSLADYSPRGHKESDVTAHMHHALHIIYRIHVICTIHIIHRAYIYTEREYIYICVYIYSLENPNYTPPRSKRSRWLSSHAA